MVSPSVCQRLTSNELISDDIEVMFEPILAKTKKLVQRQIRRVKKAQMPAITVS
jgi:hypothetical protein